MEKTVKSLIAAAVLFASLPAQAAVFIAPRPIIVTPHVYVPPPVARPVIVPRAYTPPPRPIISEPVARPAVAPIWLWVPIAPHSTVMRKCDPRTDKRQCK